MTLLAIVDASALIASADRSEPDYRAVNALLERTEFDLIIAALALAEATYFLGLRLGPRAEAQFVRNLAPYAVEAPTREDLVRMADLMEEYADFPLGAADASIVALAERLETDVIVTLGRRHLAAVRPRHCPGFQILPE